MFNKKGRSTYCPPELLIEVEDIIREDKLPNSNPTAMRELVKYARIGRECHRIMTLDFSRKVPLPRIANPIPQKFKKSSDRPKKGRFLGGIY